MTDDTVTAKLAEWEALTEGATEGPWSVYKTRGGTYVTRPDLLGVAREWSLVWQEPDAEFIAAAREMVTLPSSSGWRITSNVERLNSGNSSRKRTP